MIVLCRSIVAVIAFIPLATIQHFIPPVSPCLLADICNHTWIPICAWDKGTDDYKRFLDQCDFYEYNCDNDGRYEIVNYADCFNPSLSTTTPCPSLDKLMTKILGYYIFEANGAKTMYSFTTPTVKRVFRGNRRYTPEKTRKVKRRTTPCSPCERNRQLLAELESRGQTMKQVFEIKTMKKRSPGQVVSFVTKPTVVLKNETVWKNGKMMHKVVKGFQSKLNVTKRKNTRKKDTTSKDMLRDDKSDFLENLP